MRPSGASTSPLPSARQASDAAGESTEMTPSRRIFLIGLAMLALIRPSLSAGAGDWNEALATYAQNPFRNRRALLALRGEDASALPPLYLLALGESSLRA